MMSRPMLKTALSPLGVSAAVAYQKGIVLSVDLAAQLAEVQFADRRDKVSITPRRGKGGIPAKGETWVLDQTYGSWMFAVLLDPPRLPDWIPSVLLAPWAGAPVGYLLDSSGMVRLRGTVAAGVASTSTAAGPIAADVFRLQKGYRPEISAVFPVASNHSYGEITVLPDGYVRASAGAVNWSLDPVAFPAQG